MLKIFKSLRATWVTACLFGGIGPANAQLPLTYDPAPEVIPLPVVAPQSPVTTPNPISILEASGVPFPAIDTCPILYIGASTSIFTELGVNSIAEAQLGIKTISLDPVARGLYLGTLVSKNAAPVPQPMLEIRTDTDALLLSPGIRVFANLNYVDAASLNVGVDLIAADGSSHKIISILPRTISSVVNPAIANSKTAQVGQAGYIIAVPPITCTSNLPSAP